MQRIDYSILIVKNYILILEALIAIGLNNKVF